MEKNVCFFSRVYIKSAKLEWALEELKDALKLVEGGLELFPETDKLWMMKAQVHF